MRQILVNLLSNAIKFTDTGSVCIKVQEISPDQVLLTVQDTGIGIAEENLKHIFEEFRQVDQSLAKRYPGTGLGLAITHSLVQLMHGKISVESHLGQGSTFNVEFPRRVSI
jgi:signal transduction histidine kinase